MFLWTHSHLKVFQFSLLEEFIIQLVLANLIGVHIHIQLTCLAQSYVFQSVFWSEIDLKQSKKVSPPKKHKTSLVRLLGILWIVKRAPKKACVLRFRSLGPKHGPTVLRCNSLEKEGFGQKEGSGLWSKGVERCEGHPVWTVFLFFSVFQHWRMDLLSHVEKYISNSTARTFHKVNEFSWDYWSSKACWVFNQACGIDSERLQTRDLQLVNILV